ncbi:MAG: hypothetical protein JXD22_04420 [Sedimentisphaerales bacterium]|nr:hypothetical protein [Sedimentisphaerales bacterium]
MMSPKHWMILAIIAVAFSLVPCCTKAEKKIPEWKKKRIDLKECYVEDEFRVFYALEGESALSAEQKTDTDKDGVPDKIQNIARQLVVARQLYVEVFKLRHPFESPRYKDRVKYFDVHVASMPSGNFGLAGDGIVNYARPTDPKGGYDVLTIDVSKDVSCTNLTPAHELFHEFQNGYTLFKNAWFTEGTARWVEYALLKGVGKAGKLPASKAEKEALYKLKYDASGFWNALAQASDGNATFCVPKELAEPNYVGTQQQIIQDRRLHGIDFMRAILEELDAMDDKVSKEEGLNPLDWSESRQNAAENNDPIWTATLNACRRFREKSPQMRKFIRQFSQLQPVD